ncbi:Lpg1974 family pore-forming outer membrane protein [Bremerella cremea]|uniref:Lpg1974 family pore-forming outer membrane protein n=1 Tax=Bremerella cremea TaxID=1031537 RepID=UPI0031ED72A4
MRIVRFTVALGLTLLISPLAMAQKATSKSESVLAAAPRRLQVSANARPAATRVAAKETRPTTASPAKVMQTSHVQHQVVGETIYSPGEMMVDNDGVPAAGCYSDTCNPCGKWFAGFEATFLMPSFSSNVAYTLTESDGTTFENSTQVEFDSGLQFSPRVYAGFEMNDNLSLQVTWWRYDHDPDALTVNPPANGFGTITPPTFQNVDISTTVPGSSFSASSGLSAYSIDVELMKEGCISFWKIGVAGGVRYAEVDQSYFAQTRNVSSTLSGQLDYSHRNSGFGPTMSLYASLPLNQCLTFYTKGRGSLLFGEASSTLSAGEDLDLTTSYVTSSSTSRDDLLTVGEIQLGLAWESCCPTNVWQPYATVAMEGQFWNGVGNASSEEGNLGFFGVVTSAGVRF